MTTYSNRLQQQMPKSMNDVTANDPNKMTNEVSDNVAWAMAQNLALSKVKLFTSMAKSINDQQ